MPMDKNRDRQPDDAEWSKPKREKGLNDKVAPVRDISKQIEKAANKRKNGSC